MRILLSPAKKMRQDREWLTPASLPALLPEAKQVLGYLRSLSPEELKTLWGCSDAIAEQNLERLRDLDPEKELTPAILSYDGIAFQYMAPSVFSDRELSYVQEKLRILSALYGALRPLDGVRPYRLEMQARAPVAGAKDLYGFWGRKLYDACRDESGIFLNLASKEYFKCIQPYLTDRDTCVTCFFGETVDGKLRQKATFAKMARGEMVRYLAGQEADRPEAMQGFDRLGFRFREDLSSPTLYTFERTPE